MAAAEPADIPVWLRLDDRLTSSGQPNEAQLAQIARLGVTTVINLALHSHEKALADEAGSVAALGMHYIHIPVAFDAPTEADFAAFCDAMRRSDGQNIHVHCIINARVSAFIYRWRRDILGWDEAAARNDMDKVWKPLGNGDYPQWAEFVKPG